MSSGTFHYRAAERLARIGEGLDAASAAPVLAAAQVHATLALAAASAEAGGLVYKSTAIDKASAWHKALHGEEGRP